MGCLVYKMLIMTSEMSHSVHKDSQYTVKEGERNQRVFTFKKLESENFDFL